MFSASAAQVGSSTLYVDDVFSTYLYTGNGSTQTINNGIDLAGQGGLVWIKNRNSTYGHRLGDTVQPNNGGGQPPTLDTSTTGGASYTSTTITSKTSTGFTLGSDAAVNDSTLTYVSWTFRKAPKFFDVVTYTGNGTNNRKIAHSLGSTPGCIFIKATNLSNNWFVWHQSFNSGDGYGFLNLTQSFNTSAGSIFGDGTNYVAPTATQFTVAGSGSLTNANGITYVAYLFAHDTATDGIIQCGSFTTDGSGNATVTLGWEPQWLLTKSATGTSNWWLADTMRGMTASNQTNYLSANTSNSEAGPSGLYGPTSTGFNATAQNASQTYIYIAIRRPNKPPTTGTQVFSTIASSAAAGTALTTNFPVDMQIGKYRTGTSSWSVVDRLRGVSTTATEVGLSLATNSTAAEGTFSGADSNNWGSTGFLMPTNLGGISDIFYNLRRAPGFFDEVCYTGTGSATTVAHNLGVVPELMIVKGRSVVTNWFCYYGDNTKRISLESAAAATTDSTAWNNTTPSASAFTVGTANNTNYPGGTFVAYLFATLPGISKVFSYTGNGSSQTINCGFTTGARFVLIKRTDSTGDWYVWDSARGIVAGNDPHLSLNSTAAEVTTDDSIDPDTSGFIVNQVAATNINVSSATYIFLAIA